MERLDFLLLAVLRSVSGNKFQERKVVDLFDDIQGKNALRNGGRSCTKWSEIL